MNKWVKRFFYSIGALSVLGILLALYLVSNLPGPREISSILNKSQKAPDGEKAQAAPSPAIKPSELAAHGPNGAEKIPELEGTHKKASPEVVIMNILDTQSALDVCANLHEKTVYDPKKKDNGLDFDELFDPDNKRERDPYLNTFKYPIQKVFQDEKLSALLREVVAAKMESRDEKEFDTLAEKIGFYSKAALTVAHLRGRKREFEILADRSRHLSLYVQMAKLKPELLQESDFLANCDSLQNSIAGEEEIDIKRERAEILKIIKRANLEPFDLDFKPESYMDFQIKTSGRNLSFKLSDDEEKKK